MKDFLLARKGNTFVMGQLHHNSNTTVNENSNTIVGCLASAAMEAWPFPCFPCYLSFLGSSLAKEPLILNDMTVFKIFRIYDVLVRKNQK